MRLKQFSLAILVVLSLFASNIAACCCSHHQEKTETKIPSCHQKNGSEISDSFKRPCVCSIEFAPKIFAKSDTVKIKKQAAKIASIVSIKFDAVSKIVADENFNFPKPFYLSDSFYRHKSPRAPPIA